MWSQGGVWDLDFQPVPLFTCPGHTQDDQPSQFAGLAVKVLLCPTIPLRVTVATPYTQDL